MGERTDLGLILQPGAPEKPGRTLLTRTMALIAKGAPLRAILDSIVLGIEAEHSGMLCSILLLDESGQHLMHGAAPSLPAFYLDAINGVAIGPSVGSCGTAAYTARRVIVRDIQADPLWAGFTDLAREAGLASCWSEPIRDHRRSVLGAFAMYHREARGPTDEDIRTIKAVAHLAAIAIERKRAIEALSASEVRAEHANAKALEHWRWVEMAEEVAGVGHWRRDSKTGAADWSDELFRIYGLAPSGGAPDEETVISRVHPDDRATVAGDLQAAHRQGKPFARDVRIVRPDGEVRHVMSRASAERGPDGEVSAVFGVLMDVTEAKRAEQVLRESEERYRLLAVNVTDIIAQVDLAGVITFITPACERLTGFVPEELIGTRILDRIHPDDAPDILATIAAFVAAGPDAAPITIQYRVRHRDGHWVWIEGRPRILFDAEGQPMSLQDAVRDISERRAAEERQTLMVHELNHRVKNTLATVQSMAMHTQKSAETPAEFADAFNARLMALSHSHDLLTQNSWSGAWLRELVTEHLKPYQNANGARFDLAGPDVRVTPKTAVALGMALGELATNAAKYGALSVGQGRVSVGWELQTAAGSRCLRLVWREYGGPPVRPPTRRGFGSRLIERGLSQELGGSAHLAFRSCGASCEIEFPIASNAA